MSDWIHGLPVVWMAVVVFGGTYLVTAAIYWLVVVRLAVGDRARAFKGISPGLLPPIGIMFGLLVAFLAAQVWGDVDRAHAAVNREASSLRAVVLLSRAFPDDVQTRLRGLVGQHVQNAQRVEWPAMSRHRASLSMMPTALGDALEATIALPVSGEGQVAAQREILAALESALDARRQRILVSRTSIDWVKWLALVLEAIITLIAIAMVHSDNRLTARLALGLFSTAVAVCIILIATHHRPFTGQLSVRPDPLLQIQPDAPLPESSR